MNTPPLSPRPPEVTGVGGTDSQRAGGQVGVLVLQFSVQSQTSFLSVVGQKRRDGEDFTEGGAGSNHVAEDRSSGHLSSNVMDES